jgi:hypothetical protein
MVGRSLTRRSFLVGSAHADEFVCVVSDKCGEFHVPSFSTTPKSAEHVLRASVQVIGTVRSFSVHAPYTQHLLLKPSCLFAFYPSAHVNYASSRDDMGRLPQAADFALYCLLLVVLDVHQARRKAGITTRMSFLELMHDLPTAEVWNQYGIMLASLLCALGICDCTCLCIDVFFCSLFMLFACVVAQLVCSRQTLPDTTTPRWSTAR